jgi:uncharacterized membrane protein
VSRTTPSVPRWAITASFLLSLIGLAISIYLTITHFEKQLLLCSSTGTIDCAAVTTSPQSYFLGVPVAILGLGNFVVMSALTTPWAWRAKWYWIHVARFVLTIVAMAFVLWLIAAELLIINHICLWCTGVHAATFGLLIVLSLVCPAQLGWTRSAPE